jgi:FkbM family methyltransferase
MPCATQAVDPAAGVQTTEIPYGTGIVPLLPPEIRRARLLAWQGVDVVLDIGANAGQYGRSIRKAGFGGRIVSFEPLGEAFEQLALVAADDAGWVCHRLALGTRRGSATLNVSRDLEASSILAMEDRHVRHWPPSAYVGTEVVTVERVDSLASGLVAPDDRLYLKVDVQGYELQVLRGACGLLPQVVAIEAELSLVPLYREGPLYREVIEYVAGRGFQLVSIEGITEEPETGHMLQLDGVFVRGASA